MNGGTCHNLKQGAYECQCPPGYDGPQCERRMITCAHDNPCQNGAECQQVSITSLQDFYPAVLGFWSTTFVQMPSQLPWTVLPGLGQKLLIPPMSK